MTVKAKYHIDDTFLITGRGIVFAGYIIEGEISLGDYIEFCVFNKKLLRKIVGIEGIRIAQPTKVNTGLLIKCRDESEIKELRKIKPSSLNSTIKQIDKPVRLWADFNATGDFGLRLNCNGTVKDLKSQDIELIDGMELLLWDEDFNDNEERDDLIVSAIARFNDKRNYWEGEFEWSKIRHESDINK